jgi:drug/metabolite transporter (DMT)-like permease
MRSPTLVSALFIVLWATGFIGAGYAMPWAEPFTFLAVRFVLALAILVLVFLFLKPTRAGWRDAMHATIAGALMHGVYLGAVFWAIHHGFPSGFSALIVGLQPLITALLAATVLGEQVLPRHWAGLAVGFLGVAIVLSPRVGDASGGITAATLGASFLAVLAMSAGTIWQKRFVTKVDLVTGTFFQYIGGAALMIIAALAFETRSFTLTGELVFAMFWLVLVLSIGAIFLLMYLIREGAISKVSSLFYLVPSVTAVMAWILFGEMLTSFQILGMVIAALGVALVTQPAPAARARASR